MRTLRVVKRAGCAYFIVQGAQLITRRALVRKCVSAQSVEAKSKANWVEKLKVQHEEKNFLEKVSLPRKYVLSLQH